MSIAKSQKYALAPAQICDIMIVIHLKINIRRCDPMKTATLAILACLLLLLAGCSGQSAGNLTYSTVISGQDAAVTFDDAGLSGGSIAVGGQVYTFACSGDGSLTVITYPDGYAYTQSVSGGVISVPSGYDPNERAALGYIDGASLASAVSAAASGLQPGGVPEVVSLLVLAFGGWMLVAPRGAWRLFRGRRAKDTEPSRRTLNLYRVAGCAVGIAGLFLFVM